MIQEININLLKDGFISKHKNNFRKHVAQLLKYYLYDDMAEREIRFGKKL